MLCCFSQECSPPMPIWNSVAPILIRVVCSHSGICTDPFVPTGNPVFKMRAKVSRSPGVAKLTILGSE